mmetsp:Transcript_12278/g.30049  ORF Transcript_12278/g.30049 Transcript_12278/m.30049 type:complete len:200 (+) Transcript_12278:1081-1680(+)
MLLPPLWLSSRAGVCSRTWARIARVRSVSLCMARSMTTSARGLPRSSTRCVRGLLLPLPSSTAVLYASLSTGSTSRGSWMMLLARVRVCSLVALFRARGAGLHRGSSTLRRCLWMSSRAAGSCRRRSSGRSCASPRLHQTATRMLSASPTTVPLASVRVPSLRARHAPSRSAGRLSLGWHQSTISRARLTSLSLSPLVA